MERSVRQRYKGGAIMKIKVVIPTLIDIVTDVTVEPTPVGRCYKSDEIQFHLFGQSHVLTFTIDERYDTKTLFYSIDHDYDEQTALREEEFSYQPL